ACVPGDVAPLDVKGDFVLLEFCLHEMPDPTRALAHARACAPDVLVIDHRPESRWSWYAGEERDMPRAGDAVTAAGPRPRSAAQPAESHRRIEELRDRAPVTIPMPYGIALL